MSKANIKEKVKLELAIVSGGCCERCGIYMYEDFLTKKRVKFAEHAHIIPDSNDPIAPRAEDYIENYDRESCENLMPLCSSCHTIIDKAPQQFTKDVLLEMKHNHEDRIRYLVSLREDKEINTIIYSARIKDRDSIFNRELVKDSILRDGFYPKNNCLFDLSCSIALNDDQDLYYEAQVRSLINNFEANKINMLERKSLLFALAPQPLLIRLGMLFNKQCDVLVKQKTREPNGWFWIPDCDDLKFKLNKPKALNKNNQICLLFSISDNVDNERIYKIMGENIDIWRISINNPNLNCILKSKHVDDFSKICLQVLNAIVSFYGTDKIINVFPVMPNSLAIEFGRCYLPKVHNGLVLYDQVKNQEINCFKKAFSFIDGVDKFN